MWAFFGKRSILYRGMEVAAMFDFMYNIFTPCILHFFIHYICNFTLWKFIWKFNSSIMDLLRSEPMQLILLIIPIESAHRSISYLGDLGLFQFKDVMCHSISNFCPSRFEFFKMIWITFSIMSWSHLSESIMQLNEDKSPFQRTYASQVPITSIFVWIHLKMLKLFNANWLCILIELQNN
jgi:hypothetical protein